MEFRNLSWSCIRWNICIQDSLLTTLFTSVRCWTMDSLYTFKCKLFRNTRHTVTFGTPHSRDTRRIEFRGPRTKFSLSCSTVASETHERLGDLALRTEHSVSTKFLCHESIVGLLGGSLRYWVRNFPWTCVADLIYSFQNTQRACSAPVQVAIFISIAGLRALAALGDTVPRASNLQCFGTLCQFKTLYMSSS
jgi:hypothetical protein